MEIDSKVHDEHAIVRVLRREEPQGERRGREHAAVNTMPPLGTEGGCLATEPQQIDVQRVRVRVRLSFVEVQLAPHEGRLVARIVNRACPHERRDAGKLHQELATPFPHGLGELGLEVGEEDERRRGLKLLPLKQ